MDRHDGTFYIRTKRFCRPDASGTRFIQRRKLDPDFFIR
jgi:hypothetical protein